jgi:hypothetical protein
MAECVEHDTGWLLERGRWYWGGECAAWTPNPNAAVRFARRVDAERAIALFGDGQDGVIAVEHSWSLPAALA